MRNLSSLTELVEHFAEVRHQVKNDMSVIIGFTQLLQIEIERTCGKTESVEKLLQQLKIIHQRARKVVEEIDVNLADPGKS